jgi:small nuclear ribonucleoprotein (snRNP)-like protein
MSKQKSRETAITCKTLICFLESLVEQKVVIELKDDTRVFGTLMEVDAFMNCTLSGVTVMKEKKILSGDFQVHHTYDSLFIKGTRIRIVEYPDEVEDEIRAIQGVLNNYRQEAENRIRNSKRQPKIPRDYKKEAMEEKERMKNQRPEWK